MPERERSNVFTFFAGLLFAVWYSNRERRHWVDEQLDLHGKLLLSSEQRAAARKGMVQAAVTVLGIAVAIAVPLIAAGTIKVH